MLQLGWRSFIEGLACREVPLPADKGMLQRAGVYYPLGEESIPMEVKTCLMRSTGAHPHVSKASSSGREWHLLALQKPACKVTGLLIQYLGSEPDLDGGSCVDWDVVTKKFF